MSLVPPVAALTACLEHSTLSSAGTIKCHQIAIHHSRGPRADQLDAQHYFCSQSKAPKDQKFPQTWSLHRAPQKKVQSSMC